MKKNLFRMLLVATFLCGTVTIAGQESDEEFRLATLNVDGLPQSFLNGLIKINAEGPGEQYTPVISQFLAQRKYDIIAVQENFDYNTELCSMLEADYQHDSWPGKMEAESFKDGRWPYDGINAFWRNGIIGSRTDSVAWERSHGDARIGQPSFDHCFDSLTAKGFRRYEFKLKKGAEVVVYNLHMDATDAKDELTGNDVLDSYARITQLRQVRESILSKLDRRPVIVCGDFNCYYSRDRLKEEFIDYIRNTGRAVVGDVWMTLRRNGVYPALRTVDEVPKSGDGYCVWTADDEQLDKILYVNPVGGSQLIPISVSLDSEGYVRDDGVTPLGDHFPVTATFGITTTSSIVNMFAPDNLSGRYYDLQGRRLDTAPVRRGFYILRPEGQSAEGCGNGKKLIIK